MKHSQISECAAAIGAPRSRTRRWGWDERREQPQCIRFTCCELTSRKLAIDETLGWYVGPNRDCASCHACDLAEFRPTGNTGRGPARTYVRLGRRGSISAPLNL